MLRIRYNKFIAAIISIVIICILYISQRKNIITAEQRLKSSISYNLIPLQHINPESNFEDLEILDTIWQSSKVLGLGEATHGTKEFFKIKHRIIKYLVENKGYNLLGLEAVFSDVEIINDYVLDGKGEAYDVLSNLGYPLLFNQEMLDLIKWIRKYNLDKKNKNKVKIYGIDTPYNATSIYRIINYVNKVDSTTARLIDSLFYLIKDEGLYNYKSKELTDKNLSIKLNSVKQIFDQKRIKWLYGSSEKEYSLAFFYLTLIEQALYRLKHQGEPAIFFNARDRTMAENVRWIMNYEGKNSKMIVWAHNYHIQKSKQKDLNFMGYYLDKIYGTNYYAVALDFGMGSFHAIKTYKSNTPSVAKYSLPLPPKSTFLYQLSTIQAPVLFLKIRNNKYFSNQPREQTDIHSIGAVFNDSASALQKVSLSKNFDGLIFINKTSATTSVE